MLVGGLFGGFRVAGGDGFDDFLVVAAQAGGAGRADDVVEVQVQQALAFAQQAFVVADEVGVAPGLGDGHVEGLVQLGHRLEVAGLHGRHVGRVGLADRLQVLVAALERGQAGDRPLDEVQRGHVVGELLDLEGGDQGGAVGQDGHQAFAGQPGQGIAHRRARQAELRRQGDLVQLYAGLELEREDLLAQLLVDIAPAMAAPGAFHFFFFGHHQVSVCAGCVIQTSPPS